MFTAESALNAAEASEVVRQRISALPLRASAPLEQQDKPGHSCGMKGAHHVKCL
jgi:hypothetical protein